MGSVLGSDVDSLAGLEVRSELGSAVGSAGSAGSVGSEVVPLVYYRLVGSDSLPA